MPIRYTLSSVPEGLRRKLKSSAKGISGGVTVKKVAVRPYMHGAAFDIRIFAGTLVVDTISSGPERLLKCCPQIN